MSNFHKPDLYFHECSGKCYHYTDQPNPVVVLEITPKIELKSSQCMNTSHKSLQTKKLLFLHTL